MKKKLRKTLCQQRKQLSDQTQSQATEHITKRIITHELFLNSKIIAGFCAHNKEIDPQFILQTALQSGKTCCLPILNPTEENKLIFIQVDEHSEYTKNKYGILEPVLSSTSRLIPAWELDLVLVPLVGVDRQGHRLGMGAGFYDRSFAFKHQGLIKNIKTHLMGLAYDFQYINHIPHEAHDIEIDSLMTENEFIFF